MSARKRTKSLGDIQRDMSELYDELKLGNVDLKVAGELANITGKNLKAVALKHAREEFLAYRPSSGRSTEIGQAD